MKTFKSLYIAFFCLAGFQGLSAQQVYQTKHYGSPGDIYLYNRFTPGLLNDEITRDGAGVTWDLTSHLILNTHANEILETGDAINQFNFLTICSLGGLSTFDCLAVWNSTDQAVQLKDSLLLLDFVLHDLQRYQAKVSNLLLENFIGFTVDLGGTPTQAVIVYQIPDTILQFPVKYGDAWTSHTEYGLDLNPAGQNILYHSKQSRSAKVDGWGTLQTPYDTFENVIRLRSDILRLDTIVLDTGILTLVADQVEFMWLDTNYTLPLMTANGLHTPNDSIILTAVEYVYESTCPAPLWTLDVSSTQYYLDESGNANIDFTILNPNANEYNWDFGDGQFAVSSGSVSHTYSAPGEYSVVVVGCMTNCLPLNSCAFQIIDFEIADTTTSVLYMDGRELGIRMYPNPVTEILTFHIPETTGLQYYSISDMTGRILLSGSVQPGKMEIPCEQLSGGVYTIQLRPASNETMQVAVMRFQKLAY